MSDADLPAVDTAAAELFWSEYAAARPEAVRLCPDYTVERFGDSAALADGLLRAVTEGAKRDTSELADEFLAAGDSLPRIGAPEHRKYWTRVRGRRGLEWTEADEIVFERFRVVWPPELADPA